MENCAREMLARVARGAVGGSWQEQEPRRCDASNVSAFARAAIAAACVAIESSSGKMATKGGAEGVEGRAERVGKSRGRPAWICILSACRLPCDSN